MYKSRKETNSFRHVKQMYEETLNDVLLYEKADVSKGDIPQQFNHSLTQILNRHRSVVEQVAHGVMEYKEDARDQGARLIEEEKIQYFLDRFYMSRIAIRVLINQHGKYSTSQDREMYQRIQFRCSEMTHVIRLLSVRLIQNVICEKWSKMRRTQLLTSAKNIILVHPRSSLKL